MKNFYLINKISKKYRNVSVEDYSMTFAEFFNVLVFEIKGEYPCES